MTTTTNHTSPTPSHSWVDGPMLGFDLETTGVDRFSDLPVAAALVLVEGAKVLSTDYFLIDPGRPIPPGASAIHGISTERARSEGISLTCALKRIYEAISGAQAEGWPIVGMNLSYDLTMLDMLARAHLGFGISPEGLYVLDALVIDRHIDTYRPGKRRLVNLAEHYGVALPDAHNAAGDATAALYVVGAELSRCPDLANSSLADLTASQATWHRRWAASYSSYRVEHGLSPLEPADFEWPIARGRALATVPSEKVAAAHEEDLPSAGDAHRSREEGGAMTQQYEEMQTDERPVDLELVEYRSYLMEIEEEERDWRARREKAEQVGRRICDVLDKLAYGGAPPLCPLYGPAIYVSDEDDAYQDVFVDRQPLQDIALLKIPSWPGVSSDLHTALMRSRGIPRLYIVATGDPDPYCDGVLVAMCVTDILDPRSVRVVVTCPEAYQGTKHRWQRAMVVERRASVSLTSCFDR